MTKKIKILIFIGVALLLIATALFAYQPHVDEVSYNPPGTKPIDQVKPAEKDTSTVVEWPKSPYECGKPPENFVTKSGWVSENNPYLCLTIQHPADWRLIGSGDLSSEQLDYVINVQRMRPDEMPVPVTLIYALKPSSSAIPFVGMALKDVRAQKKNIGTVRVRVYAFDAFSDAGSQGSRMLQYFVVDVPSMDRLYVMVGYYFKQALVGFDTTTDVRTMILAATPY